MQDDTKRHGIAAEAGTHGGAMRTEDLAINETENLIASDKVEGTPVYNHDGEHLGSVYNVMIDKRSGQVRYAVMSFGGFLGMGERYHPLPWDALHYDERQGGYIVNVSRERIEGAPSYTHDETPWADPRYDQTLYGYYGLPFSAPLPRV